MMHKLSGTQWRAGQLKSIGRLLIWAVGVNLVLENCWLVQLAAAAPVTPTANKTVPVTTLANNSRSGRKRTRFGRKTNQTKSPKLAIKASVPAPEHHSMLRTPTAPSHLGSGLATSIDETSLARFAVLTSLNDQNNSNSFWQVFPNQVNQQANQISAITNALTTATTPNSAVLPNPPLNSFTPEFLNGNGPLNPTTYQCATAGYCLLNSNFLPLAFTLYKLQDQQESSAQYSALLAALVYTGANVNLAITQLSKLGVSYKPALSAVIPAILTNFIDPTFSGTYSGLVVDPDSGILVKTPAGTPVGTASQFCQDLVTAQVTNSFLNFTDMPTLTANSVWLGGICTDNTHCCGNNICNTTSGANLGSTSAGKPYGYCDLPGCSAGNSQTATPCDPGYVCDLSLKNGQPVNNQGQCVKCVPVGNGAQQVADCCPSGDPQSPNILIDNVCSVCTENGNNCTIGVDSSNTCCSGFCVGGQCAANCVPGLSCCTDTGTNPATGAPNCPTITPCCSSLYTCGTINSLNTGSAGNKCCLTGDASPGNQNLTCNSDADCCLGAMCLPDATGKTTNKYCVSCGQSGDQCGAAAGGQQCCDNQQLTCDSGSNSCVNCIGQSCANGGSCCSTISNLGCGIGNDGTANICCLAANATNCTVDQDCCQGSNCINGTCTTCSANVGDSCAATAAQSCCNSAAPQLYCAITAGQTNGTCQNCVGAVCTGNSDCCPASSAGVYYCDIPVSQTTGTCQLCAKSACATTSGNGGPCASGCNGNGDNFCQVAGIGVNAQGTCTACAGSNCTGSSCATNCDSTAYACVNGTCTATCANGCADGSYCDTTVTPNLCKDCAGSTCTGSDGTACDSCPTNSGFVCKSKLCTAKPSPTPPDDSAGSWSTVDTIIVAVVSAVALVLTIKLICRNGRCRFGTATQVPGRRAQTLNIEYDDDILTLSNTIAEQDPGGYASALRKFMVARSGASIEPTDMEKAYGILTNYQPTSNIAVGGELPSWAAAKIAKAASSGSGHITDSSTIELLKIYNNLGLLNAASDTANYSDLTFSNNERPPRSFTVEISSIPRAIIDAAIGKQPNPNPRSPIIVAAADSYISGLVGQFSRPLFNSKGTFATMADFLGRSNNLTIMRRLYLATSAELVADDHEGQYTDTPPSDADIVRAMLKNSDFAVYFTNPADIQASMPTNGNTYFAESFASLVPTEAPTGYGYANYYRLSTQARKFACALANITYSNALDFDQMALAAYMYEQAVDSLVEAGALPEGFSLWAGEGEVPNIF